ncbi:hypothetical protein DFJ77DRAFT_459920 [Powellomyces hirtus]|nr:hypothetical protein DFJ77DRAFT_459920 [Powellomyces hirtus]
MESPALRCLTNAVILGHILDYLVEPPCQCECGFAIAKLHRICQPLYKTLRNDKHLTRKSRTCTVLCKYLRSIAALAQRQQRDLTPHYIERRLNDLNRACRHNLETFVKWLYLNGTDWDAIRVYTFFPEMVTLLPAPPIIVHCHALRGLTWGRPYQYYLPFFTRRVLNGEVKLEWLREPTEDERELHIQRDFGHYSDQNRPNQPWPFVTLTKLAESSGSGQDVVDLLCALHARGFCLRWQHLWGPIRDECKWEALGIERFDGVWTATKSHILLSALIKGTVMVENEIFPDDVKSIMKRLPEADIPLFLKWRRKVHRKENDSKKSVATRKRSR